MTEHQLVVRTEVLDQIEKSLMQSLVASKKRRRRIEQGTTPNTRALRDASVEAELLAEGLQNIQSAQAVSWGPDGEHE